MARIFIIMREISIGELEEIVLLVVGNLSSESYGNRIRDEIQNVTGRALSLSAIHTTLHRLEKKQLLTSQYDTGGDSNRRGRPKLIFSVSEEGFAVLQQIQLVRNRLWEGLNLKPL